MPLEALIFDVDGTLAETEELHRDAFNASFAAAGLPWTWDQALYAELLAVTGGKERITHFVARQRLDPLGADAVARLHADKTARYTARVAAGDVALRPGVARLLRDARAAGLRLAIATTTSPPNVEALLRATLGNDGPGNDGPGWFEVIAAGDCVAAKKPAADVYLMVLERLGLPPRSCIAFEDTVNGLRSAGAAGIPTVVTLSAYGGTMGFEDALAVVDHLGEPGAPCRHRAGPGGGIIDVAWLRALAA